MFCPLYMPFPSALLTLHIATSGLSRESQASCFAVYLKSVLVSTGSLLVTALDRFFLVFYPLKRVITLRIARFLIGVIWIFAIVFMVPLFKMTTLVAFEPDFHVCTFQFWNHWLRYHLFIILLPCGSITAYHCYHPHLRCDWIQTETHHSTR